MEKQKTAVDLIIEHLNQWGDRVWDDDWGRRIKEFAKTCEGKYKPTEKEQIEKAWNKGAEQCYDNITAEEYYTNTYTDETKL